MSISARERQALDSISSDLASSAPELASMLAMFCRLTADEEMPARDPVRNGVCDLETSAASAGRADWGRVGWRQAAGATWRSLWLVAVLVLLTLTMTLTHATRRGACPASLSTSCGQVPAPAQPGAGWP